MSYRQKEAYQEIRKAILNGYLRPGERLIEKDVCEKFRIGRTPLREALRQLEAEGYVEIPRNKGAIVRKISIKELEDIYDMVAVLEAYAVEQAIKHMKPKDKEKLRNIQNRCKEAGQSRNYGMWLRHNALFHGYFAKLCGNNYLYKEVNHLRMRVFYAYDNIATLILGPIEKYIRAHEEILKAVYEMNERQASSAMRRHVLDVKKMFVRVHEQYPLLT
jgi:DNA-binding GntR family transcriptional regulator